MRFSSLAVGGLCLAWSIASLAQTPSTTVSIAQDGLAHPGGLGKARVSIGVTDAPGVLGASIPILFDSGALEVISAFPIGALLATNGGAGPDFFNWAARDEGMLVGYIVQLIPPAVTLQTSGEVFTATFFVKPTQAGAVIPLVVDGVAGVVPPLGYDVILQLADTSTLETDPTPAGTDLIISNQFPFVRGDANQNGGVDLVDAIRTLEIMFLASPPECEAAADCNNSGDLTISDTIMLLEHLFGTGIPLEEPFLECGGDQVGLPCTDTTCP